MPINSFIQIPKKIKLPSRIDIRVKMDAPSMYLILGKGHITFGTTFLDNRRIGDIVEPNVKATSAFNNKLEMNKYYDLSIIYDLKFMQILINGEERFFSKKEKYIKSPVFNELNRKGFELKIAGSKQNCLVISSITVTEFDNDELINLRSRENTDNKNDVCLGIDKKVKSDFDECISGLSLDLQKEIKELNDYLINNKNLKVKRKIEGNNQACKINYVSSHGFSYAIHVSENIMDHFFWWYMVSNYKYENKYMGRKNDLTAETLKKVAETSPDIAEKLFTYFYECNGCGPGICQGTTYEYKDPNSSSKCNEDLIRCFEA
jgi:hypothetical protein